MIYFIYLYFYLLLYYLFTYFKVDKETIFRYLVDAYNDIEKSRNLFFSYYNLSYRYSDN